MSIFLSLIQIIECGYSVLTCTDNQCFNCRIQNSTSFYITNSNFTIHEIAIHLSGVCCRILKVTVEDYRAVLLILFSFECIHHFQCI